MDRVNSGVSEMAQNSNWTATHAVTHLSYLRNKDTIKITDALVADRVSNDAIWYGDCKNRILRGRMKALSPDAGCHVLRAEHQSRHSVFKVAADPRNDSEHRSGEHLTQERDKTHSEVTRIVNVLNKLLNERRADDARWGYYHTYLIGRAPKWALLRHVVAMSDRIVITKTYVGINLPLGFVF